MVKLTPLEPWLNLDPKCFEGTEVFKRFGIRKFARRTCVDENGARVIVDVLLLGVE